MCVAIVLMLAITGGGVASADDWSLPDLDPEMQQALTIWPFQSAPETLTTEPTTPPWTTQWTPEQVFLVPNSWLLAPAPEPPATTSRQSLYDAVCELADVKLPSSGPDVVVHIIEDAAEKKNLSEGLLLNAAGYAVSRACPHHLAPLGHKLFSAAWDWLSSS